MPLPPAPRVQDPELPAPVAADIEAAERIAGIPFTAEERDLMVRSLARSRARFAGRPRDLENGLAPATSFDPWLGAGPPPGAYAAAPAPGAAAAGTAVPSDADLAFAPAWELSRLVHGGVVSSEKLVQLSLERIAALDDRLLACISVPAEAALAAARRADAELAAGKSRGPLHGLPYGAKDLFDTAGLATTFGAAPYRDRVPEHDAAVVERLAAAGAVLVAKTSLGALAMGDVWFGGRTRNPWNPEQGSSGSSAGSASGVAAGLFPFALGTETYGSIVSPSVRCGVTGLRPTFGRVPRDGAMALCWSLDKVGPLTRSVRDTRLVLDAIAGPSPGDPATQAMPLEVPQDRPLRVGVREEWFQGPRADPSARVALEALQQAENVEVVEVELPEGPAGALMTILNVEAAAAFEELTRSGRDDELTRQDAGAWPNSFRSAWMVPAVELVQADRLRRRLSAAFEASLAAAEVDALLSPPFAGGLLLTTNFSGHPCLALRAGVAEGRPRSVVLWGRLAGEGALFRLGEQLEQALGVAGLRPELD